MISPYLNPAVPIFMGRRYAKAMKTTVEIADAILVQAKDVAAREGTTIRSLIEEGLQLALDRRSGHLGYTLPDASVGGSGLTPEARGRDLSALAYEWSVSNP